MFGYIKPFTAELKVKEHLLYKSIYCGLCRTQRKETGFFSPLALSYDFVFLYLLRAELEGTPTVFKQKKRGLRKNREPQALPNSVFSYCAACAALLGYLKLKDNLKDEHLTGRVKSLLLLPYALYSLKKAEKHIAIPTEEVKKVFLKLNDLEKNPSLPVEELAECSGTILALLAGYGIEDPLLSMAAEKIGLYIGKWIYLTDAADDLEKDRKSGSFNPFAQNGLEAERLKNALDNECNLADHVLAMIPVYDNGYRAILKNILFLGMNDTAETILFCNQTKERHGPKTDE